MSKNNSRRTGVLVTVLLHGLLLICLFLCGVKAPSADHSDGMEVEWEPTSADIPVTPPRLIVEQGTEPRAPQIVPEKEPELVQQAVAPEVVEGTQRTQESSLGDNGDVEKSDPQPATINPRTLYRSRDVDTLAGEQTAQVAGKSQAGDALGNTTQGNPYGTPTARLAGRSVVGKLPSPEYTENTAGQVVVRILVDTYGKVTSATPGVQGTTVQNKTLWEAAKKAALEARFNVSGSAPAVQEGTITYVFTLR